jgi:hypothetical protein
MQRDRREGESQQCYVKIPVHDAKVNSDGLRRPDVQGSCQQVRPL